MATSEIEKLERRYAENPHGLTFAPLAEVHRKIGDIPRALELLTAGLELHPNYIPASIVLGRCHQDRNDLAAAEAAFAHVLRLDDENVIALKSLADINERQQRFAEAEAWLRRLVSIDRSNEEAREQLERVEAAKQRGEDKDVPASAPPALSPEEASAPPVALEMIDLTPESASTVISEPAPVPGASPMPVETAALNDSEEPRAEAAVVVAEPSSTAQEQVEAPAARPPEPPAPPEAEEVESDVPVQPLPGLISAEFQPPLEATGGLGVETSEEVVLEVSGNSEFSVPDASEDLKSVAARLDASRKAPVEDIELAPTLAEPTSKPDAEPESLPKETVASGTIGQPSKNQSYLARDTNGQSVGDFFQALLAARLEGLPESGSKETAARTEGAGGPVAGQNGAGFLEPGYGEAQSVPIPPAVASPEPQNEVAVSFDDFFNSQPEGPAASRQGKGDPGKDDLDQFQTWLQNLKR